MASQDLLFRFLGVDMGAGREFDRMSRKASLTSGALKGLALGAAAAAAGVAVASVKAASSFQTEMTKLQTQAGKSAGEVKRMSAAMLSLAGPTATAPTELAKGLYHLESAGIHGANAIKAMRVAAEGAKLGGANLEDVTNALNAAISSGIPGVKNMNQAMGYLNATVGEGDMRMQDLADALSTGVLKIAQEFGVTMRDASAALATFGDHNIRGAQAGTDLRVAIQSLAAPSAKGVKILHALGLQADSFAKAMQHGGLNEALHLLKSRMDQAGVSGKQVGQVITDAFGRKSSASLAVLVGDLGRFDKKFNQSEQSAKHFGASWAGYTKTFSYRFDQMRAAVQVLAIKLGNVLLPAATALAKYITQHVIPAISSFGGWVKHNSGWLVPLAKGIIAVTLAMKAVTLATKGAAAANILFGRTAVTAGAGAAAESGALATLAARIATVAAGWKALGLGLGRMIPLYYVGANSDMKFRDSLVLTTGAVKHAEQGYINARIATESATGATLAHAQAMVKTYGAILKANGILTVNAGIVDNVATQYNVATGAVTSFAVQSGFALQGLASVAFGALNSVGAALAGIGSAVSGTHAAKQATYASGARRAGDNFSTGQSAGGAVVKQVTQHIAVKAPQMSQALADALAGTSPGTAGSSGGGSNSTGKKVGRSVAKGIDQALQAHMSKFKTDLSNARQFQSSLQSSLAGYAALSGNTGGTDILGASGAPLSVQSYLRQKARSLERFVHLLKRLDHLGLSRNLLEQFANIGPDAIPAMQQLLSGGRRGIRTADRLEAQVEKYAGQAATMVTRDRYGKQLHDDLERLPDRIARKLSHEFRHLHIITDTKLQDRKHGHRVRAH